MIVEFRFDDERPRAWMTRLAALLDDGHVDIQIAWVRTGASRPAGLEALFELERMLLRNGRSSGADAVSKDACGTHKRTDRKPDIVIDFTNVEPEAACSPRLYLRPLYNGAAGEDAVLAAILSGDLPLIEIRNEIGGEILDAGLTRRISDFRSDLAGVSVALLFDVSGSMEAKLPSAREAATHVLTWLDATLDEAAVYTFDTHLDEVAPFTIGLKTLPDSMSTVVPFGATSLHDAIAATAQENPSHDRVHPHRVNAQYETPPVKG